MLFQATNVIPDIKSGIGLGTVDAASGIRVSWQVNGDYPVMTAMSITIYLNDTASTQKYTTGKVSFQTPFYGTDAKGELQYYGYTIDAAALSAAGITNGNEYKLIITQYYMEGSTEKSVTQNSASVFITRAAPTFELSNAPNPLRASSYTFQMNYSQAQGDTLDWVRYQIAQSTSTENIVYDSGNIYGASVFECTYDSFRSLTTYAFRAMGQTSSGVSVATQWQIFYVTYDTGSVTGDVTASVQKGYNAVYVDWSGLSTISGQARWVVFRESSRDPVLVKIADASSGAYGLWDYGVASGQGPYRYMIVAADSSHSFIGTPVRSNEISPIFYRWTLLVCDEDKDPVYGHGGWAVKAQYHFRLNLDSGSVGNNNSPKVLQNFTANPTVQPAPQNYLTGTLNALLGAVSNGEYMDTLEARNALMALSVTEKRLYLKSSKGDVKRVMLAGAVTATTAESTPNLAQTISLPWIALADGARDPIYDVEEGH